MPSEESTLILLPKAMDRSLINDVRTVGVRAFPVKLFVRRSNGFVLVQLLHAHYSPAWAKVTITLYYAGVEYQQIPGDNGKIDFQTMLTDQEPVDIRLENNSIDTEVRFTLVTRGWQYGEV